MEEAILIIAENIFMAEPISVDLSNLDEKSAIQEGIYRYFENFTKYRDIEKMRWVDEFLARPRLHKEILQEIKIKYFKWEPRVQDAFFRHPLYCRIISDFRRKVDYIVAIFIRSCGKNLSCAEEITRLEFDIRIYDTAFDEFAIWGVDMDRIVEMDDESIKRLNFLIFVADDEVLPITLRVLIRCNPRVSRQIRWNYLYGSEKK